MRRRSRHSTPGLPTEYDVGRFREAHDMVLHATELSPVGAVPPAIAVAAPTGVVPQGFAAEVLSYSCLRGIVDDRAGPHIPAEHCLLAFCQLTLAVWTGRCGVQTMIWWRQRS
jgi:hypothetical protein